MPLTLLDIEPKSPSKQLPLSLKEEEKEKETMYKMV